ncbi:phosphoglycolate phosphatase [Pseudoalteromonas sp. SMS1]|uniref:HAD family hydrolase n=1 Tax=Pseudoalteromonas sp. SMS1 TaxID=2908894 RepID=UPI001F2C2650|nr:HAD family hydrolase [Pseudoalteromonas sp. SMS1]MCF2858886.1 phosphoglycolate phosphatase [Pseudoalteromonas sp. SMS1]
MSYQGVIFDLDGTLVDSVQDMHLALNLALSDVAFPVVSEAQVRHWVGNGIDKLVMRGLSCDFEVSPDLSDTLIAQAIEQFKLHYQHLVGEYAQLYPEVESVLRELSDVPKAVVTNKNRVFTLTLLQKLNIDTCFDVIVCGDDGNKKPDPELLHVACEQLGLTAQQAIMVGDSKSDILAAHNAGMPVIALTYGYNQGFDLQELKPEYLYDRFLDIIPVLNKSELK